MSIASIVLEMLSSSEALLNGSIAVITGLIIGYLLGSINCAYLVSKLGNVDISKVGDGNPGASNVFRHVGLVAGIVVAIGDIAEGALAVVITRIMTGNEVAVLTAGVAAFLGHLWPVFLRFRGGVGIGIMMGVFLALFPIQWLCAMPLGIVVFIITRNSIFSTVVWMVSLGLLGLHFHEFHYDQVLIAFFVAMSCLVGLTLWLKTRHLPRDMKKERLSFWIAKKVK